MNELIRKNSSIAPLTKEEELHLGHLFKKRKEALKRLESNAPISPATRARLMRDVDLGEQAQETMIRANKGLVYKIAMDFKRAYPGGLEFEDIVQEGMVGLMTAISKYDSSRGNKFSTMAYHWIRQSMVRKTNENSRLVRLPENRVSDLGAVVKIQNRPEVRDLPAAQVEKIILNEVGLTPKVLANIRAAGSTHASLNKVVGGSEGGTKELMDYVGEARASVSSEETMLRDEMLLVLEGALESLEPLQQKVLRAIFRFDDSRRPTAQELQKALGITPQEYRRAYQDGLTSLRTSLTAQGYALGDFVF